MLTFNRTANSLAQAGEHTAHHSRNVEVVVRCSSSIYAVDGDVAAAVLRGVVVSALSAGIIPQHLMMASKTATDNRAAIFNVSQANAAIVQSHNEDDQVIR